MFSRAVQPANSGTGIKPKVSPGSWKDVHQPMAMQHQMGGGSPKPREERDAIRARQLNMQLAMLNGPK